MSKYRNYMETLVEELYDEYQDSLQCCTCQQCRNDVIAYALNHLPPRYVVSPTGEAFAKLNALERQYRMDAVKALGQAAQVVAKNPRH